MCVKNVNNGYGGNDVICKKCNNPSCNPECQKCKYSSVTNSLYCENKPDRTHYSFGGNMQGICVNGASIPCPNECLFTSESCKSCEFSVINGVYCRDAIIGKLCAVNGYEYQGVCKNGKCETCPTLCNNECQKCIFDQGNIRCGNFPEGVPCNDIKLYLGDKIINTAKSEGVCINGVCIICDPECDVSCEKCADITNFPTCQVEEGSSCYDYILNRVGKCVKGSDGKVVCTTIIK
ncbi:MAG: hypothetical protein Q8N99_06635 [Nanoarchaeota archaeon]|nr:hypothetical protein [Nanoarchaeota archaeon]